MDGALIELIKREGKYIVEEFQKASITGEGTPQEVADFREGYFKFFLERYFPFPYRITKGGIIDSYGRKSDSVDCVVCNPIHPHTLDKTGKFNVIFADGVDVAIEIKPNLSDKRELHSALRQVQSVKKLRRAETVFVTIFNDVLPEKVEFGKTVLSVVFALKAKHNIEDTIKDILDYYIKNNIPLEDQFDLIVINNACILYNQKYPNQYRDNSKTGFNYGYFLETWDELTIAGLLLYLDVHGNSTPKWSNGILYRYLKDLRFRKFDRVNYDLFWRTRGYSWV